MKALLLSIFIAASIVATSRAEGADSASSPTPPLIGVYTWGSPGLAKGYQDQFTDWLNRPIDLALDFQPLGSWSAIEGEIGQLRAWSKWVHAAPGRRLVLSVQLLPGASNGTGPNAATQPAPSLEQGALGAYNDHFRRLADNLVKFRLEDSILRLGWEFNGGWYVYRAVKQEDRFIQYWKQIVTTMRAVPGAENLQYCWNPSNTLVQFDARKCWPGDEYVDFVGVDVYDQSWFPGTYPIPKDATPEERQKRWELAWSDWNFSRQFHGLQMWSEFARNHHKPLTIPEWGVCSRKDGHGGGDNVYFIEQMHRFITDPANNVYFHCYFNVNAPDGGHQLTPKNGVETQFPNAAKCFHELFSRPVTPRPTTQGAFPTTQPAD
jgi:hypothetical protein